MSLDTRPPEARRLEKARLDRGFKNAKDAARFFGWIYDTYIQHERGDRGLTRAAAKYAKAFKVSRGWLLTGEGEGPASRARIVGRVGANPEGTVLYAEGDEPRDYAEWPPGGAESTVALEVEGHSMRGWADHGALIFYEERRDPPTDDMLGEVVIVGLDTGEVLLKRLLRGSRKGRHDLESVAGPMRTDARVTWAAHVTAIIPPKTARRIIFRG